MAFTYGDYTVVIYTDYDFGIKKYAHFQVTDTSKTSYSAIPATVTYQGKSYPVSLHRTTDDSNDPLPGCFEGCKYLITSPALPAGIKSLYRTFDGCTSLATAPTIPSSVQDMSYCFWKCFSLATAPTIPSSVQDMSYCFYMCATLTTAPTIPSSVQNMRYCFYMCVALTTAPTIPSSVTRINGCFMGDVNLSGNIVINAAIRTEANYSSVLTDTEKGIWLTGSSPYLQSYADTASEHNVFVGEIPLSYNLAVERVGADGEITSDPEGTWLHLILDLSWSRFEANSIDNISLQKNATAMALTWYTDAAKTSAVTLPGWQPNAATTIHAWVQATVSRQILVLSVSDTYHTGKSLEVMVPSSFRTIDFLAGGKGIAFGKVAEQEGFECAMDALFEAGVFARSWAGFVQMFAGATAPSGWLVCDGSEVAVADYPLLYAVIGDTYGTPSDSDHFILPDLRGRTPIGVGQGTGLTNRTRGQKVGEETHKLKGNESGQKSVSISSSGGHTHSVTSYYRDTANYGSGSAARPYTQSGSSSTTNWASIGSDTGKHTHSISESNATNAHNNMQPSLGINFIICTGETA